MEGMDEAAMMAMVRDDVEARRLRRIFSLILNESYQEAMAYLEEVPECLASLTTDTHRTTLHMLCDRVNENDEREDDAIALAQEMLRLLPELATVRDEEGEIPLHSCVRYRERHDGDTGDALLVPRSTRMALLLIEANPETVSQAMTSDADERNPTPFHLACQANADITVLRAMLEIDPSLASKLCTLQRSFALDIQHDTPLFLPRE
jgi:ankyrin repeat protein